MAKNSSSLLSVLKNLYSQLSQIAFGRTQLRLNTYKQHAKPQVDIASLLNKEIEDISSHAQEAGSNSVTHEIETTEHQEQVKTISHKDARVENTSGVESEFVKYVKQRHPTDVTQPHIGEELKASAWKHIHAAMRSAKSGNQESAKLHIDIASTAIEESGDYMSPEDYSDFVMKVESYFSEANKK